MIKVLHIITRLDPGGSSTNTIETVSRLDRSRFDVFLISGCTVDPDGSIASLLNNRGVNHLFMPELQREISPVKDFAAFFRLHRFIKAQNFDVVHTHSSKAGILGRWAAKWAGVRCIVHTPHGHIFYGYFGRIKTRIFIWTERAAAIITDRIITLTERGKTEHVELKIAPAQKFVTISSGIDINAQVGPDPVPFVVPPGELIFGSVARLDPVKGTKYLLDAMALVVKQCPQSHLFLVGDGSEAEKLRLQCVQLGIADKVTFTGFQKQPEIFIRVMDVFVLASLNEGMGRVILEAMVQGKPVIATKVGGVPELIEDGQNGLIVAPGDADALASAMIRIGKDRVLREAMGGRARAAVTHRFDLWKMVRDIELLYDECLR